MSWLPGVGVVILTSSALVAVNVSPFNVSCESWVLGFFGSCAHCSMATTDDELNGFPFVNLTPECRLSTTVLPSALTVHDEARFGSTAPFAPSSTSGSNMSRS